jgi:hypothetical protein
MVTIRDDPIVKTQSIEIEGKFGPCDDVTILSLSYLGKRRDREEKRRGRGKP